ncbi:MAG: hypothetical protein HQ592_18450 [Planctomycetes bacterium]|nr:hypothetical protein [Planctomycetota bacterium]
MIDSRQRGKRARRALEHLGPDVRARIEQIADEHAQRPPVERGTLIGQAKDVVGRDDVANWCRTAASSNVSRIWQADATAAAASVYFQVALDRSSLKRDYVNQMAAIIVPVLKEPVRTTWLHLLRHGENPATANTGQGKSTAPGKVVWEHIYTPLAGLILSSLASLRLVEELAGPAGRTVHPFGWAPGVDSLRQALQFALLGQRSSYLPPMGFIHSVFARYIVRAGYASIVPFQMSSCRNCQRRFAPAEACTTCTICGNRLETEIRPRCLSIPYLQQCKVHVNGSGSVSYGPPAKPADPRSPVPTPVIKES